ncbi:hypothetical protein K6U27_04600 [Vibrio fluvialis]|uniref:hypothetical protein n=1 Tax=Vibrio fluvialis TaxID=676 RepID=UPI001EEA43A4|nr:hypothetical protein [Vibrio fluvialis]MCG6371976.1 hypothetical protein [Vibrio fluvialis]
MNSYRQSDYEMTTLKGVNISTETFELLQLKAIAREVSLASLIREVLNNFVKEEKKQ